MKQTVCITLLFSILLCLFSGCAASDAGSTTPQQTTAPINTSAYTIDTAYVFPMRDGVEGWEALKDEALREAIKVPEDYLKNATTRALVETLYGYPRWQQAFLIAMLNAHPGENIYREDFEKWSKSNAILAELLTRPDMRYYLDHFDPTTCAIRSTMTDEDIAAADDCFWVILRYAA